jgi:hypothetical protein
VAAETCENRADEESGRGFGEVSEGGWMDVEKKRLGFDDY